MRRQKSSILCAAAAAAAAAAGAAAGAAGAAAAAAAVVHFKTVRAAATASRATEPRVMQPSFPFLTPVAQITDPDKQYLILWIWYLDASTLVRQRSRERIIAPPRPTFQRLKFGLPVMTLVYLHPLYQAPVCSVSINRLTGSLILTQGQSLFGAAAVPSK